MSSDSALIQKNWKSIRCAADLMISAKSYEYKVHRIIFLCLSPYFQILLDSREQSSDGYYRIDMKDVSNPVMDSIITFAYNGQIDITEDSIEELVITADKYNIISIIRLCEQFLAQSLTQDNCIETYLLSHYYNCHDLRAITQEFLIGHKVVVDYRLSEQNSSNGGLTFDKWIFMVLNEWHKRNKQ